MKFPPHLTRSILGLVFLAAGSFNAHAAKTVPDCNELLADVPAAKKADRDSEIRMETHNLLELIIADKDKNLAYQNIAIMMNSAQRVFALMEDMGYDEVSLYGTDGKIKVPRALSTASELNDFRMISGHELALTNIRFQILRAISNDSNVITVDGPHGTGKSEILAALGALLKNSTRDNPDYKFYTWEWTGLDQIDGLQDELPRINGKPVSELELDAPENVMALLPDSYVDWLKDFTDEKVRAKTESGPKPFTELMPMSKRIREAIIEHYTVDGKAPTDEEIMKHLAKHVVVKRATLGEGKNLANLDAQGRDWKPGELFMKENPIVSMNLGQGHPNSWELGIIPRAANSILFLDEFLRNQETLQDKFLTLFQERKISQGGAPTIPLDMLIFVATNTANVQDVLSDPKGDARIDRLMKFLFGYTTEPQLIMQTMSLLKRGEMYVADLNDEDQSLTRIIPEKKNQESLITKIWPRAEIGEEVAKHHGEYTFYIGDGPNKIAISPHVIEFMSYVIAATRMKTDQEEARKIWNTSVIDDDIFKDPVQRIRFFNGEKPEVNEARAADLARITRLMGEGHDGIVTREANRWMNYALARAGQPGKDNTLTLQIAMDSFKDLIADRDKFSEEQRLQYGLLADKVHQQLIVPAIEQDIHSVISQAGEGRLQELYEEFIYSELALTDDPTESVRVKLRNGDEKPVDKRFLELVEGAYQKATGKPWSIDFIRRFEEMGGTLDRSKPLDIHKDIMEAVEAVYAHTTTTNLTFMESYLANKDDDATEYQTFERLMSQQYGYNLTGLEAAIDIVRQAELIQKQQAEAKEDEK